MNVGGKNSSPLIFEGLIFMKGVGGGSDRDDCIMQWVDNSLNIFGWGGG